MMWPTAARFRSDHMGRHHPSLSAALQTWPPQGTALPERTPSCCSYNHMPSGYRGAMGGLVKMLLRCPCLSGLERQALLYCLLLTKIVKFNSSPTMNCYHNTSHTGKQPFENCGRVLAA
ncbi:unnamed protein product [Rangifer tarandus platyrhynchus]|uniref:Uncharacterized protein n=2 Tax=Rangifer tarandus platyrhynchus TaxID=3082113 RepID=A0ABN8Y751_RANTA|nr:unnamed protein product [Rangifer tarandus platyrhynchus]